MNEDELELGHYGRIFRRSWWILLLSVLAMLVLALFLLPGSVNFYESKLSVRLVPSLGDVGRINDPINEDTEAAVAMSLGDRVLDGSEFPETTLESWQESMLVSACLDTGALIVTNDCNTQILDFQYRANSPEKATYFVERSAQTYLDARLERSEGIRDSTLDRLNAQLEDLNLRINTEETILSNESEDSVEFTLADIRLRRIEPERLALRSEVNDLQNTPLDVGFFLGSVSTPVADASGVPRPFTILAGILMGLIVGGLIAVLLDRLDRRVSNLQETEVDLGVPVLGDIPRITEGSPELVTAVTTDADGAEAFRRLAAAALAPRNGYVVDTIAVTSANEGEGRTTAAINLALAISQTGRPVLFVASDRRNKAVDQLFGLTQDAGLNDFLRTAGDLHAARSALDHAPQRLGISVMSSGTGSPTPLSNNGLAALLAVAEERGMITIFDTPPALTHSDGLQIAAVVDAVYIVAAVGQTRRSELTELRVQLLNVQADVVGSIINRNSRLKLLKGGSGGDAGPAMTATQAPGAASNAAPQAAAAAAAHANAGNQQMSSTVPPQASPTVPADLEVVEDALVVPDVPDLPGGFEESA